jgi:hypothetical protein
MSTFTRTITAGQNPESTRSAAEEVAANLRSTGHTVVVGEPYDNVTVRHYGLSSVDLQVTEPEPGAETAGAPSTTTTVPATMNDAEFEKELAKDDASNDPDLTEDNVLGNDKPEPKFFA